jgi:plastocyanin
MTRLGALLFCLAAVLAAPAAGDVPQPLQANVGPGFVISLRDANGVGISHLDPGTYAIHVTDQSEEHNFHLSGPGVDMATDVPTTGTADWTVTLTDGTYRYVCDAHATTMHGIFTVGTVAAPATTQKLSGSVGPGSKISFVRGAKAGKAVLTIRDRSAKDNFHLTGPGVNRKTGVGARGTVTWTVTLRAGTYRYRSDAHPGLKGSTRVS